MQVRRRAVQVSALPRQQIISKKGQQMFTDEQMKDAENHPTLGPAYFCSRDVVERAMAGVQASDFKPLIDRLTKEINDVVWSGVQDHLLSDTEMNLQGAMYQQVDDCVKALLSGQEWALNRYALGPRYDHEKIREAVAKHIPKDLQDARIADLEARVAELKKELEWRREFR